MSAIVKTGPSELAGQLAAYAESARGAYASNTERAIKTDTARFAAWCAERGLTSLPADPATVAAYADDYALTRAGATVQRAIASIAHLHRAAGLADPTKTPDVRHALKRMYRAKGRRQKQAAAITYEVRSRMIEAAGSRLIDTRNKAMLAVAYDTGCRRSELVALAVTDFHRAPDGTGAVYIGRSKTDQEGQGVTAFIAADTVSLVAAWLLASGIVAGALFRAVNRAGRVGNSLAYDGDAGPMVAAIFRKMAEVAGLPAQIAKAISGHSTRVGMAQDMTAAGIELPAIMQAGRWKTPQMAARYAERQNAKRSAAAKLAAIQGR